MKTRIYFLPQEIKLADPVGRQGAAPPTHPLSLQRKERSMAIVLVPTALRKLTSNLAEVEAAGSTVGEVLKNLAAAHPAVGEQIFENGKIRGFVNVFLGDEDIRFLDGDSTPVKEGDEITLIPAIAGGF